MAAFVLESAGAHVSDRALPILNQDTFKQTAGYLAPDVVATYTRTIAERSETLLQSLRETVSPDAALAEAAHALAGSAGLFGFERVATTARHFERSVLNKTPDMPAFAGQLAEALELTLRQISEQTCAASV
jgi:HPt (histidine-containing phosphotransfer) domain-containing protein